MADDKKSGVIPNQKVISGEPNLGVVVAKKGAGKTEETKKEIKRYVAGDPSTGAEPRRVIIIDCNDEYTGIKSITVGDVPRWCDEGHIEVRRLRIYDPMSTKRWSLNEIADNTMLVLDSFYKGMMVLEDLTKYVNDSMPADLIGTIATQRHQECDMIIQFQLIQKLAHPKIYGLCNWIRFHKLEDSVKKHASKFSGNIDGLFLLEALVEMKYNNGDKYFKAFYDKDSMRVKGEFSQRDFAMAIDYYLERNPSVVKEELDSMDLNTGGKKYKAPIDAINAKRTHLMTQFYGN